MHGFHAAKVHCSTRRGFGSTEQPKAGYFCSSAGEYCAEQGSAAFTSCRAMEGITQQYSTDG